jgi:hypothetical protein
MLVRVLCHRLTPCTHILQRREGERARAERSGGEGEAIARVASNGRLMGTQDFQPPPVDCAYRLAEPCVSERKFLPARKYAAVAACGEIFAGAKISILQHVEWSGREDLNLRPPGPEAGPAEFRGI